MVRSCCAYNCTNIFGDQAGDKTKLKFHRFPHRKPELFKKWIIAVRRTQFYPSEHVVLCGDHFSEDAYKTSARKYLKDDAVPSIFNFSKRIQKMKRNQTLPFRHPIEKHENNTKDEVLHPVTTIPSSPTSDDNCSESIDVEFLRNGFESTMVENEATKEQVATSLVTITSPSIDNHCPEPIASDALQNNTNFILVAITNGKVVTCPVKVQPPTGCQETVVKNHSNLTNVATNSCPVNISSPSTDDFHTKSIASGISNINSNLRRGKKRGRSPTEEILKRRIKLLEEKLHQRDRKIQHLESLLKEKKLSNVLDDTVNIHKNTSDQLPYVMIYPKQL